MKRQEPQVAPDRPEAVHVAVAEARPVDELDAELERALRLADELRLLDLEEVVERDEMRDGRLADPDDADLLGLDQSYLELPAEGFAECRRRHPAGTAPADDDDGAQRLASGLFGVLTGHGGSQKKEGGPEPSFEFRRSDLSDHQERFPVSLSVRRKPTIGPVQL